MSQSQQKLSVSVQHESFDVGREFNQLQGNDRGIGAIVSFVGLVRDLNLADDVVFAVNQRVPGNVLDANLDDLTIQPVTKVMDLVECERITGFLGDVRFLCIVERLANADGSVEQRQVDNILQSVQQFGPARCVC